ncbi:hypothetical protein [Marinobacter sediminicola]|uniref:hypothetical protein n=1 Tax=Marinobacter sediminicola TaxID=3072994 RepID=UPI002811C744|nr:hypothetical protein [Marinobacter sp. F26243]
MAKTALVWLAPKDSRPQQIFIAKAEEAGYSAALVRNFFYQINAHPQLLAFVQISRNLVEILRFPSEEWLSNEEGTNFGLWQSLCLWVAENVEGLVKAIGPSFDERPRRPRHNPLLRKGVTRHPLYCALWNRQENPELQPRYSALQAQALCAHARVVRETHLREEYEKYDGDSPLLDSPKSAHAMGLALRDLSHGVAEEELMATEPFMLPSKFGREVRACLRNINPVSHSGDIRQIDRAKERRQTGLRSFVYFIERAYGTKSWVSRESYDREGGGGGEGEPGYVDFQAIVDGSSVDTGGGTSDWYVPAFPPQGLVANRLKHDEPPFDDGQGIYFFSEPLGANEKGDTNPPTNPALLFLRARNQSRHIAMANQHLPWRYQSLTDQEIHNVVTQANCYLKAESFTRGSTADRARCELALLVLIVLWTGASWEKAWDLRVQPVSSNRRSHAPLCLVTSTGESRWRVKATFPEYKSLLRVPDEVVRPQVEHVLLPDLSGIGDSVMQLLKDRGLRPSPKTKLFTYPIKQYKRAFRNFVQQAGESERVTWGRWEKVMFDAITAETGDVVDAVAITGQPHVLAQTKCYYYTPREGDLFDTYVQTALNLAEHAELELDSNFERHLKGAKHLASYVGSRACASKEAVVKAVADLKCRLRSARTYSGWADFALYHNIYTFYTVQMLAFATGYRAVKTPFLVLDEVNEHLCVTVIADKDDEHKRKTRLSYLPGAVCRQLEHYERHLQVLSAGYQPRLKRGGEVEVAPCFFISESNDRSGTQEVRPRTMQKQLDDFLGLPANAHRRFMRMELKEAGCPADYVNAFMGHASYGEEPWCRYSSLSTKQYRDMMVHYLEPIINELTFEPVASRLAGG